MKKLTDEEWERLLEILHALRHGKKIQTYFADEWREDDGDIELYDLLSGPMGYRVRPEPKVLTLHVWRTAYGDHVSITQHKSAPSEWQYLYSFEHEVQQ